MTAAAATIESITRPMSGARPEDLKRARGLARRVVKRIKGELDTLKDARRRWGTWGTIRKLGLTRLGMAAVPALGAVCLVPVPGAAESVFAVILARQIRQLVAAEKIAANPAPTEKQVLAEVSRSLMALCRQNVTATPSAVNPSEIQSIIFDRGTWTPDQARSWLRRRKYTGLVEESEATGRPVGRRRYWRFRQQDPHKFARIRTVEFGNGIKALVGFAGPPPKTESNPGTLGVLWTVNPEEPATLAEAKALYSKFHRFPSTGQVREVGPTKMPGRVFAFSPIYSLFYRSNKWDGVARTYYHDVTGPSAFLATPVPKGNPNPAMLITVPAAHRPLPKYRVNLGELIGIQTKPRRRELVDIRETVGRKVHLLSDASGKVLLTSDQRLWIAGGRFRVTRRGIEG